MSTIKTHIIIAGGGTGGHIFPAVAIAQGLEKRLGSNLELLFVGAKGRMEMEKVPALGYKIEGLEVAGFQRSFSQAVCNGQIAKDLGAVTGNGRNSDDSFALCLQGGDLLFI